MSSVAWLSTHIQEKGTIRCDACAHACTLHEGEYGRCGIRKAENGDLHLLTYGVAAAVTINTADKQPLVHYKADTRILSVGTVGCYFACAFCQNHDLSQYPNGNGHSIDGRHLLPEQIVDLARRYECEAIAYTYNEPATYFEYCYDTARLAHEAGLKNIYVTSGFETKRAIDTIAPFIDVMILDLKGFNEPFYATVCGGSLEPVLETIRYVHAKKIPIEITTPVIPDYNDSDDELGRMAAFISQLDPSIAWHLLPFKPMHKMTDIASTPFDTLHRARIIAKTEGLENVFIQSHNAIAISTACNHGSI